MRSRRAAAFGPGVVVADLTIVQTLMAGEKSNGAAAFIDVGTV